MARRSRDFAEAEPFQNARPFLLALGRLVGQKGFDILIQAFSRSAARERFDLLIAGEGPERANLEELAHDMRTTVRFLGRADRVKVASLFRGCTAFVLPSRADEGLPVVCAEALAAGRATIAADVGGVGEIVVDGQTGWLVPREDPAALASAIDSLVSNPDLCRTFGENAHRRSGLFAWPAIVRQYIRAYRDAIAIAGESRRPHGV